jgi:uncharacterized protein YegJ (DUF2314 family)
MNQAISKARASLSDFWDVFRSAPADVRSLGLKLAVRDGEDAEYMWTRDVRVKGARIFGTLDNRPVLVTNVSEGQEIEISDSMIADWKYFKGGVLHGGFTTAVLLTRITPEEAEKVKKQIGWK